MHDHKAGAFEAGSDLWAEARAAANSALKYSASRLRATWLVNTVTKDHERGFTGNFQNTILYTRRDKANRDNILRATQSRVEENYTK